MGVDEHAPAPATKIDEDIIPAPSPSSHDSPTHRTDAATFLVPLARFIIFYNIHTFLGPPRTSSVTAFSTRSPVRRCANICHVVIFRRPPYVPAPPLLRLTHFILHLLHIYAPELPLHLFHMLTYILHTNYDTQSSYKTVELLCNRNIEEYTPIML